MRRELKKEKGRTPPNLDTNGLLCILISYSAVAIVAGSRSRTSSVDVVVATSEKACFGIVASDQCVACCTTDRCAAVF